MSRRGQVEGLALQLHSLVRVNAKKLRYLIAGAWNTAFGYLVGLMLYYGGDGQRSVVVVAVVANILAISMAFVTYKLFVFQTKGNWISEYLRAYLVYGAMAIFSVFLLWMLVDNLGIPFWVSQGGVIIVTVVISYLSHSRFTFRRS